MHPPAVLRAGEDALYTREVAEVDRVVLVEVEEAAAGVGDSGRVAGEAALKGREVARVRLPNLRSSLEASAGGKGIWFVR
jgi:hypothetical protein